MGGIFAGELRDFDLSEAEGFVSIRFFFGQSTGKVVKYPYILHMLDVLRESPILVSDDVHIPVPRWFDSQTNSGRQQQCATKYARNRPDEVHKTLLPFNLVPIGYRSRRILALVENLPRLVAAGPTTSVMTERENPPRTLILFNLFYRRPESRYQYGLNSSHSRNS